MGRKLAAKLWKTFVDIDAEIMKRFGGKSVRDIWAEFGEPEYRRVEVEITRDYCGKKDQVIALGGGTLMQPGAREAVEKAHDTVRIYLKCTPEELHRRITGDAQSAATRPSLTKHGGGLDEVKEMLAKRGPVYEAVADKTFDVTHVQIDDGVRHLIEKCL